jgi:hypothetical protein
MPSKKDSTGAEAAKPARRPRSTQKYIRNLYGTPVGLRLAGGERIDLRPRGQRGDLCAVTKEQEKDTKLLLNVNLLVEVITEAEAAKVIEGQNTNQRAHHPALQMLRDEFGDPYAQDDVEVTQDPQDAGEVVAQLVDGNIVTQRVPGKGQQMVRGPRSVGPKVATDIAGGDAEFAQLLRADEAAKNGASLTDIIDGGGFTVA